MISATRNTPASGKDIKIHIFGGKNGNIGWQTVASFANGTFETSVEDQKYYYLGTHKPVSYSQANLVNITLERGLVNAELLKEFLNTMSETNCGYDRPKYHVQIEVCFPGSDEYSGVYFYHMQDCIMKSDSMSIQAGNAENTETIVLEGHDVFIQKA
jgi:hypothetical protein